MMFVFSHKISLRYRCVQQEISLVSASVFELGTSVGQRQESDEVVFKYHQCAFRAHTVAIADVTVL